MSELKITLSGEGLFRTKYCPEAFSNDQAIVPGEITFLKFADASNANIVIDDIEIAIDKELLIKVLEFLTS